jgi:hypothetical protein
MDALCIQVISAPVEIIGRETKLDKRPLRKQSEIAINPVWKVAPAGAFYKSKRLSSLMTDLVIHGTVGSNVTKDLLRLAIHVWRMPKRHFDGLCRRIRVRMIRYQNLNKPRERPEALKRFEALISNPPRKRGVKRYARYRKCRHIDGFSARRVSRKLDLVIESHQCMQCTFLRVQNLGLLQAG